MIWLRKCVQEKMRFVRAKITSEMANTTLEAKVTERTADLYATNQALEERTLQLRRLAGELTTTEQRERKQLSKVLHDGLQQYLVAAKMQLSAISEHSDMSVRQTIKTVDDLLGESVQVSRSLAAELSPPILHEGGISAGLEWLSQFMANKHGLNVKMLSEINSPLLLEEDVKIFLFEAIRELLLNVVKHAKTNTAQVSLRKDNGGLVCITVSDQGAGFDPKCLRDGYGCFGLFSIRERIALLGGNLDFESSPGNAWCLAESFGSRPGREVSAARDVVGDEGPRGHDGEARRIECKTSNQLLLEASMPDCDGISLAQRDVPVGVLRRDSPRINGEPPHLPVDLPQW